MLAGTPALLNTNRRHQSPGDFFAAIAEEKIRAAGSAKLARGDILRRDAGTFKNAAIRGVQIKLHARRRRLMPRRHHRKPRQRIGIFPGSQHVVRPIEPFPRNIELAAEFLRDFRPNFIAAAADAGAERSEDFFGTRAKEHTHTPDSFLGNALEGPAPSGMNSRDDAMLGIGKKNRNAIGSLHGDKQARRRR